MGVLKAYAPRDNKYAEAKNNLLDNVEIFYKGREKFLKGLKTIYFHFIVMKRMSMKWKLKEKQKKKKEKRKEKEQKTKKKEKEIFPIEFDDEAKQEKQKEQKSI